MKIVSMSQIDSGYQSTEDDWIAFLSCWRSAIVNRVNKQSPLEPLSNSVNAILKPGTPEYIQNQVHLNELEKSLGRQLPKSYKDFAVITGGRWFIESIGDPTYPDIISHFNLINTVGKFEEVDNVNWPIWKETLEDENEVTKIIPNKYYRYGNFSKQDTSYFNFSILSSLIKVGELEQGIILFLNPFEITNDGEWEAWFLSPQLAGAKRYRSFAEMMQVIAHQDIYEGGSYIPIEKLLTSCAKHIITAANSNISVYDLTE